MKGVVGTSRKSRCSPLASNHEGSWQTIYRESVMAYTNVPGLPDDLISV